MKTLGEVLQLAAQYLTEHGVDRPRREAEELLADQLGCRRIDLFLQFDRLLNSEELLACRQALKKRGQRLPLAYISQKIEFSGISLVITPDVLIPRMETEVLVELIIQEKPVGKVLDLCCGSGAIGLALKHRCPALQVTLADISLPALNIAKKNSQRLSLDVMCVHSDLLSNINESFDLIVCNPPYISEAEYGHLSAEVRQEPRGALVGGATGYEYYEKLAQILKSPRVWLEIGAGMGSKSLQLFQEQGYTGECLKDFAGHDRYLSLRR